MKRKNDEDDDHDDEVMKKKKKKKMIIMGMMKKIVLNFIPNTKMSTSMPIMPKRAFPIHPTVPPTFCLIPLHPVNQILPQSAFINQPFFLPNCLFDVTFINIFSLK
jgi:hypothetical protein